MASPPPYALDTDDRPDFDSAYTRCVACGVVDPIGSEVLETEPTPGTTGSAWRPPACFLCGQLSAVTTGDFLPHTALAPCSRVGCYNDRIACPASADVVICLVCRHVQPGPALTRDRRGFLGQLQARCRQLPAGMPAGRRVANAFLDPMWSAGGYPGRGL